MMIGEDSIGVRHPDYDELRIVGRYPILNNRGEPIGEEILTEDFTLWTKYNPGIAHTSTASPTGIATNGTMLVQKKSPPPDAQARFDIFYLPISWCRVARWEFSQDG